MRHRAKGRQLSRTSSHKKATLNNMATSLFLHGGIQTTEAKAKELRPFAERLITLARRGDLHARRIVERRLKDKAVTTKLFAEIGKIHCVQTRMRRTTPFTTTRTRWRLGYQRRGVLLFAWLILCPVMGRLPQISHTRAIVRSDDNEF